MMVGSAHPHRTSPSEKEYRVAILTNSVLLFGWGWLFFLNDCLLSFFVYKEAKGVTQSRTTNAGGWRGRWGLRGYMEKCVYLVLVGAGKMWGEVRLDT